jgi:hypothetical protein
VRAAEKVETLALSWRLWVKPALKRLDYRRNMRVFKNLDLLREFARKTNGVLTVMLIEGEYAQAYVVYTAEGDNVIMLPTSTKTYHVIGDEAVIDGVYA